MRELSGLESATVSGGELSWKLDFIDGGQGCRRDSYSEPNDYLMSWSIYGAGTTVVSNCATAECAAGVLPTASENRSVSQINSDLCQFAVSMVATPILGVANLALGLGLPGTLAGKVVKAGAVSAFCD